MAHFQDLEPCTYFESFVDPTLDIAAVGWLEATHTYDRGNVPPEFLSRLFELLEGVWDPIRFRGKHVCALCDHTPPTMQDASGRVVDVGATNLFVPKRHDLGMFVAPSLMLHYVIDHAYRPPPEFQAAVMSCPDTDSSAYFRRMGRIVPTTAPWRDGPCGYWDSMGAALAAEAGRMSRTQWDSCWIAFNDGRSSFSTSDLAAEAPPWFATQHIAPLVALGNELEDRGELEDAFAIRKWTDSVTFLGRQAPVNRPG